MDGWSVVAHTMVDQAVLRSCLVRRRWQKQWKHHQFEVDVWHNGCVVDRALLGPVMATREEIRRSMEMMLKAVRVVRRQKLDRLY